MPLTGGILDRLVSEATGDWILWMDASARLAPGALAVIERELSRFDIDLVYGDSDLDGARIRRPAFSPVRLRSQDYLGDLRGFRVEAIKQAGAFPRDAAGAYSLHLSLRLGLGAERVLRIPQVLTLSDQSVVPATEAGRTVVSRFLVGQGISADVTLEGGRLRVRYVVPSDPLVSIIIPTRGGRAIIAGRDSVLVVDAVRGLLERSTYSAVEIIVVADDETPQSVIDQLVAVAGDRVRLVRWSEEFNFSAKINRGAIFASGEYLVLLNDDVDVISADWIESLLGLASQPNVGLVGGLLLFEDGTVQHGGHLYTAGWAGHAAFGWAPDRDDYLGSMGVDREVSGVTAACAMIPTDTFWEVGGLSLDYSGNYNDVDLSLKVAATGRSILWTPHSRLHHFESQTRVAAVEPAELETLRAHWGTRLLADPFWPEP
ncbi:MAG: glycosyltransferase [Actinomycetota bacterium]